MPRPSSSALNWVLIGLILIGGLVYLAHSRQNLAPPANAPTAVLEAASATGRVAPNWTLKDAHGNPVSLSQFAGHPVIMDFWATWCEPCQAELPWWQQFQKEYGPKGLVIIGVSEDQNLSDVQKFLAQDPLNYRIVWDDGGPSLDSSYGSPYGLPTTLFINRQGRITARVTGLEPKPELDKAIQAIL